MHDYHDAVPTFMALEQPKNHTQSKNQDQPKSGMHPADPRKPALASQNLSIALPLGPAQPLKSEQPLKPVQSPGPVQPFKAVQPLNPGKPQGPERPLGAQALDTEEAFWVEQERRKALVQEVCRRHNLTGEEHPYNEQHFNMDLDERLVNCWNNKVRVRLGCEQ